MNFSAVLVATLIAAATPVWLDSPSPANWNVRGATLPAASGPRDKDLAPGGQCASLVRPPSSPEDRALAAKGWILIGPYQRYGTASVMLATSSADGMCRPNGFQGFVFVNERFAGTLAPRPMDSRTDGAMTGAGAYIQSAQSLSASFARYSASDALCCPHAITSVEYKIDTRNPPLVSPVSTSSSKTS